MNSPIPGYTPEAELYALSLAALFTSNLPGDIVEVGSWCGRSAVVLAEANTKVHCIDLFLNRDDWKQRSDGYWSSQSILPNGEIHYSHLDPPVNNSVFITEVVPIYEKHPILLDYFNENIARTGCQNNIIIHKGTTATWKNSQPPDFKCRLAFIDGGHSYEEVCADIKNIESFLVPGAWILFDDAFSGFPGVDRAIQELIIGSNRYDNINHTLGRLLIARNKKGSSMIPFNDKGIINDNSS